jgi:hypothetical protein
VIGLRGISSALARSLTTGALGGLALTTVVSTAQRGDAIYQPYTILVLSLAFLLWINRDLTQRERFATFVGGFMSASLILYAYLVLWVNPGALGIPLLGHAWRLGFLLGVGATLGAVATFLTSFRAK